MRHRDRDRRRGAAAVEFAAVLPFLLYLCVIGADWARLFYYTVSLEGCARAGALWAADPVTKDESRYPTVEAAARAEAPNLSPAPTVTSTSTTVGGRPGVKVTVSTPFTTITRFPGVPSSQTLTRTVEMRITPTAPN